jgi:hypothetical protein
MSEDGWVYCISNPSNLGLLKIGMTVRTPQERLAEANRPNTWIPEHFKLEFAKKVKWPLKKEQTLHKLMEQYNERTNPAREFFRISVERARLYFDLMDGEYLEQVVEEDPVEIPNNKPKRTRRIKKPETAPVIEQVIPSIVEQFAPSAPIPSAPTPSLPAPIQSSPTPSTPAPSTESIAYKTTKDSLINKLRQKHQEIIKKSESARVVKESKPTAPSVPIEPIREVPIDIRNLQLLLKELPSITIKNLPTYNSKCIMHTALNVRSLEIKTSNKYYHYEDLIKIPVLEIQKMIRELSKKECSMIISSPTTQDRCITLDNYSEINDELRNKKDSTFVLIKALF